MFTHPYIPTTIAEERRRHLIASADAYRLARQARAGRRQGREVRPEAKLAGFVNLVTRGGARALRLRSRRAAIDGG